MPNIITNPGLVTADWLTNILHEYGFPDDLQVHRVLAVPGASPKNGPLTQLKVSYQDSTSIGAPTSLLLKLPGPSNESRSSACIEARVYQHMQTKQFQMEPIPRCFSAEYSTKEGISHLILEDLRKTHNTISSPLPPLEIQVDAVMDSMANIHSAWRNDLNLVDYLEIPDSNIMVGLIGSVYGDYQKLENFLGDRLDVESRDLIRRTLDNLCNLYIDAGRTNILEQNGFTLVHSDLHSANIMVPMEPTHNTVRILDWEQSFIGIGTDDIADFLIPAYSPRTRRRIENRALKRYLVELKKCGVENYSIDDIWNDYRISATRGLMISIAASMDKKTSTSVWWPYLENAIGAIRDLEVSTLFRN